MTKTRMMKRTMKRMMRGRKKKKTRKLEVELKKSERNQVPRLVVLQDPSVWVYYLESSSFSLQIP